MHTWGIEIRRSFQLKVVLIWIVAIGAFTTLWGSYYLIADGGSKSISRKWTALVPNVSLQRDFLWNSSTKRNDEQLKSDSGNNLTKIISSVLLKFIRDNHLVPPSTEEYNLTSPKSGPYDPKTLPTLFEVLGNKVSTFQGS